MTQATIRCKGTQTDIKIKGHAGYNPGNDIVCASISALIYAYINYMKDICSGDVCSRLSVKDEPGDIEVWHQGFRYREQKGAALNMLITGLRMIEERYPDYISVEADDDIK